MENKLSVYIHFVWSTWDRIPWITEEIERRLYKFIEKICCDYGCEVLAIGGMPDHLHLFVTLPSTVALAELIKNVKGGSARFINQALAPHETFRWQGCYGAFSVSARDRQRVIHYIQHQKQHHLEENLWSEVESSSQNPSIQYSGPRKRDTEKAKNKLD